MSIIIKGLKMPKNDGEILCIDIHPDGAVCMNMDLKCRKIAEAKEIPPHGRLIDAAALLNDKGVAQIIQSDKYYHESAIQYAPTIIDRDNNVPCKEEVTE